MTNVEILKNPLIQEGRVDVTKWELFRLNCMVYSLLENPRVEASEVKNIQKGFLPRPKTMSKHVLTYFFRKRIFRTLIMVDNETHKCQNLIELT